MKRIHRSFLLLVPTVVALFAAQAADTPPLTPPAETTAAVAAPASAPTAVAVEPSTPAPAPVAVVTPEPAPKAETAPAPSAVPVEPSTPAPAPASVATPEPAPKVETASTPATPAETGGGLRRLDTVEDKTVDQPAAEATTDKPPRPARRRGGAGIQTGREVVKISANAYVGAEETADAAVSIMGSTTVDGRVNGDAVSVMGNTTVNGFVRDTAVAVMGSTVVDGQVDGEVVAVMGNVTLGPKAVVNGDVVVVGGKLDKAPGAVVKGNVQEVSFLGQFPQLKGLGTWAKSALFKARLLSLEAGAGWAWIVAMAFLGFYVLLALVFRRGIDKCVETLEQRPGYTILTTLLTMLALPLVILLLAVTGIGILLIPFLVAGLVMASLFGRAAMMAWFGRIFTRWFGDSPLAHPAVGVLFGGLLVALLYMVPIFSLILWKLIGVLGLGMVVYTLILSMRRNGAKPAAATVAVGVAPAVAASGVVSPPVSLAEAPAGSAGAGEVEPGMSGFVVPPVAEIPPAAPAAVPAMALPRAGFWPRTWALAIDGLLMLIFGKVVLEGIVPDRLDWEMGFGFYLLMTATYGVILWKLRSTTIGGIVCNLQVVRLDDRPIDWTTAIVRALGCFVSLFVVGLGFLWVAFDNEKQSWHDKIAGTAVVQVRKSRPLV